MNRDDIIELAKKAGFTQGDLTDFSDLIVHFAALIAAAEREACAKVCDDWPNGRDDVCLLANAIRARGKK